MFRRFLIGVGVGGEAPMAQAMVSELVPANVRGKYIAFMEGFWAIAYVLSGAISFFVLPYLSWRWVFVVVGSLSPVVLLVRRGLPESPRWLAERGRLTVQAIAPGLASSSWIIKQVLQRCPTPF